MNKLIFLLLSLFLLPTAFAQNETELLKKIKNRLDKVNDYTAEGRMKIDVSFINAPQSKVMVYYKKPDRIKVKKSGGISLLPKGGISVNVNSILFNEEHTIVPTGTADLYGKMVRVLRLIPMNAASDVVLATLYVDEADLVIRKYSVTTRESGSYDMELEYGKYISWGLPDKIIFSFNTKDYKLPKGITFEYDKGNKKKDENLLKPKKGTVEISYSTYVINKGVDDKVFSSE
jgi:outer membrane lipoprotein-sorting protein